MFIFSLTVPLNITELAVGPPKRPVCSTLLRALKILPPPTLLQLRVGISHRATCSRAQPLPIFKSKGAPVFLKLLLCTDPNTLML